MCLAQGPQRSDAGEARARGLSVSSEALYHWATELSIERPRNLRRAFAFLTTQCMEEDEE